MVVTVFRNAAVFDGSTHLGRVGDVVVRDGRIAKRIDCWDSLDKKFDGTPGEK